MKHLNLITNCLFSIALIFSSQKSLGAMSPLSLNIVPPVQFPPSDYDITGLRTSVIYGKHRDVYGLDLGVIGNVTTGKFVGISVSGLFNYKKGTSFVTGLELAGLANVNTQKTTIVGLQAAGLFNYNSAASSVSGVQLSLANLSSHTNIYGVQLGIYNRASDVYGLQVGIVNEAKNLHGLQIGLLNFHHTGLFVVSPILNFGF